MTEILSLHFRDRCAVESTTNQAYLVLWIAYQRGALSADEFMHNVEHEFLRGMENLEARWTAIKR
jgi:hypothetical protein